MTIDYDRAFITVNLSDDSLDPEGLAARDELDACACEWLLRDICEQFGVSEALADQAFKLYPAACQRLAAEELADDADDAE